jgi:hypothetical protein
MKIRIFCDTLSTGEVVKQTRPQHRCKNLKSALSANIFANAFQGIEDFPAAPLATETVN